MVDGAIGGKGKAMDGFTTAHAGITCDQHIAPTIGTLKPEGSGPLSDIELQGERPLVGALASLSDVVEPVRED